MHFGWAASVCLANAQNAGLLPGVAASVLRPYRTADADDRGCVPHWRSGSRKDLGEGISARPIPPLRPAKHFW